jgi:heme-degrading monooxygenase HmoA
MSTRVIIERKAKKGNEADVLNILRELRVLALHKKGYFCGETMRSIDDPSTYVVISIWQKPEDWEAWRSNLYPLSYSAICKDDRHLSPPYDI